MHGKEKKVELDSTYMPCTRKKRNNSVKLA